MKQKMFHIKKPKFNLGNNIINYIIILPKDLIKLMKLLLMILILSKRISIIMRCYY